MGLFRLNSRKNLVLPHDSLKMGPHDVGGELDGKIDTNDHGMTYWEKFSNGLVLCVPETGLVSLDELRKTAESFGDEYFEMDYFKRVGLSLVERCIQRGIFTTSDLDDAKLFAKKTFEVPMVSLPNPSDIVHLHDGVEHFHTQSDFQEDEFGEGPPEFYFDMLATAQILKDKNIISMEDIQRKIDNFDETYPARGITVVTKAWTNSDFKSALIKDAKSAIYDIGIHLESFADIICFAHDDETHHIVVCTLCSCYPRTLLGMPPAWYKSRSYRSRVVHEPREVLAEFGTIIPDNKDVKVHDSNADMRYLILPERPEGTEGWSEQQLSTLISRDHLVGVRLPKIHKNNSLI